jgi:hypothetical protein
MPTGFEMASEISFVRSICSRIESMVWSTLSTLLKCQIFQLSQITALACLPDMAKGFTPGVMPLP